MLKNYKITAPVGVGDPNCIEWARPTNGHEQ